MFSKFSVKKPYTVLVAIVLVVVLGIVSLTKMTADLLPSMNLPYAIVMTTYPGASPEEVEVGVTKPIESSMATTSNIKNISSVSSDNYSMVILEFEQSANMDSVTIEMRESLDQISGYFSDSVGKPVIMKLNPDMMPIMVAAADVDGMDKMEISQYVGEHLIPEIESIEGVASVSVTGVLEETIQVELKQEKIDEVNRKIKASLDGTFAEAEDEMNEAEDKIKSGKNELESGRDTMADTISNAQNELNDKKMELMLTESDLNGKLAELKNQKPELEAAIEGIKALNEGGLTLKSALGEIGEALTEIGAGLTEMEAGLTEIEAGLGEMEAALKARLGIEEINLKVLEKMVASLEGQGELYTSMKELLEQYKTLKGQHTALQEQYNTLKGQQETLKEQQETLKEQYKALEGQAAQLGEKMGKDNLKLSGLPGLVTEMETNLVQLNAGITQMEEALVSISEGKTTINDALEQLNKSQILGSIEMGSASAQLSSGEQKLEEAKEIFEEQKDSAYDAASLDHILNIEMLQGILAAQNFSMPAGYVTEGKEQYLIRVGDKIADQESLSELILMDMHMDGVDPIKLSDVADIALANNEDEVYTSINGNPGIMISIQKQTGYSTGDVTKKINAKFKVLMESEEGLHTTVLMDQGIYIDMIVDSVLQNMIVGGILAVIILLVFLKDLRPTIVIAVSIPVSVIFAVVLMYFSGITLNVISLSGLALGIGMLVDNSIVVIENIYRLRSEGMSAKKAAVEGAKQVAGAIAASTLTTICVFAPIVFTEGITRQLFMDMGLTIAYSLLASLIIALTFVPAMASGVLKKATEKKHPLFDWMMDGYAWFLELSIRFKPVVFLAVVVLLLLSYFGAVSKGTAFMPEMESPQMTLTLTPEKGADLKESSELSEEVIGRISDIDDIETIGAMAGGDGLFGMGGGGGNSISMYIILKDARQLSNTQINKEITQRTEDLNCEISVSSSAMDMNMLSGSGVSVQIKGRDLETLQDIAADIAKMVEDTEGTYEVSDGMEETTPQFKITVDKDKASEYSMTVAQVFQLINGKVADAKTATTISTDIKDYEVYISGQGKGTLSRKEIEELTFTYTDQEGNKEDIPLKDIASFEEMEGLSSIMRDGQERYITVSALIDEEHNIGLVSTGLQRSLDNYDCPEGYSLKMTGEDETINETMNQLYLMMLLAVIFIYLIMVAQFQSLLSPFIIMFTIPLAFTGGFLALIFSGSEVSVIALIGFVMLAGIIVNNGIVMVDYTNQLRQEGMGKKEALLESGRTRMRPILMTALTTIIAMLPMAFGSGNGSDMMRPLALVVVGGMVYGTLLTLIVVPCIYDLFHRNRSMAGEGF